MKWTFFREPAEVAVEEPETLLRRRTRRDFLLFAAGAVAASAAFRWVLPDGVRGSWLPEGAHHALDTLAARLGLGDARREKFLNRFLTLDDDVAEALYSKNRAVRTYARSEAVMPRNNYAGATPGADSLDDWSLGLSGLASGREETLELADLAGFRYEEIVTRLVCVEGWSQIVWWGGIPFADFLAKYPPAKGARWAGLESDVNLDDNGGSDPYYVSIDLETARHPQALLATHVNGQPLDLAHGAPLRLVVPMKLGLKNIKAISQISYSADEPDDYWAKRGYSKYDGL